MDLQPASLDIWNSKYRLRASDGAPVDQTPEGTLRRVANALGASAAQSALFYNSLTAGCYPGGRIMANAGAEAHKPSASLINCTVSQKIDDSMDGILHAVHMAGLTLQAGCGIGYNFSSLRPNGSPVAGAGAKTSGPISFMEIFNAACKTISCAGGRRGAQMGMLHMSHPDILAFINAKRTVGALTQFNLSVLIPDAFMTAVKNDDEWQTSFVLKGETIKGATYKARWLWDQLMQANYESAEPGVFFIDVANRENPLAGVEEISATNPCGEVPLPVHGACLLGSIDLSRFVDMENGSFELQRFHHHAEVFHEMLDRVVDLANLPLRGYTDALISTRRHGMGIMGLGTALNLMGVRYGSPKAVDLLAHIMGSLAEAGVVVAKHLGEEQGQAPIFANDAARKAYLHFWGDRMFLDRTGTAWGPRFSHAVAIAPTGTLALSFGNNCSNGIEPTFAHSYTRNLLIEGRRTKLPVRVLSKEMLTAPEKAGQFVDASDLTPEEHLVMQATAQKWTDNSISKTINLPASISFDAFKDIYMRAWEMGCKGCTTYRPSEARGAVLVTDAGLQEQQVSFKLDNGETLSLPGGAMVTYDGETSTAALWADYFRGVHG